MRERHPHHRDGRGEERKAALLDLVGGKPAKIERVGIRHRLVRPPFGEHGDEGEMNPHATIAVAIDYVENGQRADGLGDGAGLFEELAYRAFAYSFTEFLDAAREPPPPRHWRYRALHQQHAITASYNGEDPDDRPLGILPAHEPGYSAAALPSSTS